jgi:A/G-specific adenine glycosylase
MSSISIVRMVPYARFMTSETFSDNILAWFHEHGRHGLPWQQNKTPYRVWISEIMLQQTQVATVIPYYTRFMEHFPDVESLAKADEDAVLHLWTGLGYYARARNLHKAAKIIQRLYNGRFPDTVEALAELPGIGLSTAGGIIASAYNKRAVILDGNVKRVLFRYHCVEGNPGQTETGKKLWALADQHTPLENCADYNQAIMDLGASLCSRSNPACALCPLQEDCEANKRNLTSEYPRKKKKKAIPVKNTTMLVLQSPENSKVLLEKRPPTGIWGGLWSLPEIPAGDSPQSFLMVNGMRQSGRPETWQPIRHTFSHFHLDITPMLITLKVPRDSAMEKGRWHWYDLANPSQIGLAAPVKKLLDALSDRIESKL